MLLAAKISLSCVTPQDLQVQVLSDNFKSLLITPQEQVLLDGANCPIRRMFLPYQSALYSNIDTKVDQLTSLIDCAKLWFLTIFFTAKVSRAIVWFSLINLLESLCKKSLRLFTTFSCSLASFFLVRFPLFFEYLRCTYFNLDCDFLKYLGFSNTSPSDVIAKSFIPRSIPIVVFSLIGTLVGASVLVSHSIETKYLPVGVTLMVALLIVPCVGLWSLILIPSLNLGMIKRPFSTITFCGIEKLPLFDFFLNLGNPAPLKNFLKAISIFWIDCCRLCEFTSLSQSSSFLSSGNCLTKSKAL